jgi:glucoamylase
MAVAEQLYDALYQWDKIGSITVDSVNQAFFQDLDSSVSTGTYSSSSDEYSTLTAAISDYADGFMSVAQKYTPSDGSLSEQFSKNNGTALSAKDLTWSYASFLTALSRKNGEVPASWGENDANEVPTSCSATTVTGSYSSATVTSLPGGTSSATPTADCSIYRINFDVTVTTSLGQNIYLVGNTTNLGNWSPAKGASLSASKYTDSNHLWFVPVHLQPGEVIEYKYVRSESDGTYTWESDPNRTYTVPAATATVKDTWR